MNRKKQQAGKAGGHNFLISGAFLTYNLGTAAMTLATMDLLRTNFHDCYISILSTRAVNDRRLYPQEDIHQDSRTSFRGAFILVKAFLWFLLHHFFNLDIRWLRADKELAVYYKADVLVDLSGDTLTEDYGPLVLFSHCIPIFIAECFGKPIVLFGQTIGPFSWSSGFMRHVLKKCDVIIARDEPTYIYLQSLGLLVDRLVSSIDTAFLLEAAKPSTARIIEEELGYNPEERITLGMTISRQFQEFVAKHPKAKLKRGLLSELALVIDQFIEEHDAQVIIFSHVTGPSERLDDRIISKELREYCRRKDRVVVVDKELEPHVMKSLISRCALFCGARMHSNIAATTTAVPTLAMSYSVKSGGIMSRMGMGEWVVEIEDLNFSNLHSMLNDLLAKSSMVRKRLEQCVPGLRQQAAANIDVIRHLSLD